MRNRLLDEIAKEQENRGLAPTTIEAYRRKLVRFERWLAPRGLCAATRADIEAYLDTLALTSRSRGDFLVALRVFYRWTVREGYVESDPTATIPIPLTRRGVPRPISDANLARAVAAARHPVRVMLLLAALAGLRAKEIAGLCGEDVDRVAGVIRIRHGKGGHERIVPLHPVVERELEHVNGPLFRLQCGAQMRPHNVSQMCNRHLHAMGIADTLHCGRHSFGTNLYRATRDIRLVQDMLGHASPATTAIYTAFDPRGADAVRRLFGGDLPPAA